MVVFSGIFLATRHAAVWQRIPGIDRVAGTSIHVGGAQTRICYTTQGFTQLFAEKDIKTSLFGWGWDNYIYFLPISL